MQGFEKVTVREINIGYDNPDNLILDLYDVRGCVRAMLVFVHVYESAEHVLFINSEPCN